MAELIEVTINGEKRKISTGKNINDLISDLKLNPTQPGIAVAIDDEVIVRKNWRVTGITAGQQIEIIRAVGGGIKNAEQEKAN